MAFRLDYREVGNVDWVTSDIATQSRVEIEEMLQAGFLTPMFPENYEPRIVEGSFGITSSFLPPRN